MNTNKTPNRFYSKSALSLLCLLVIWFSPLSVAQPVVDTMFEPENKLMDYFRIEVIIYKVLETNGNGNLSYSLSDYSDPILLEEFSDVLETEAEGELDPLEQSKNLLQEIEIAQSEVMANAWTRLRNSRNFRPLNYYQWNEFRADTVARHAPGGVEGTAMRIHGEVILPESPKYSINKIPNEVSPANNISELVEIEPTYKLDGKVVFGQGRFLHIKLDFEYRYLSTADLSNTVGEQVATEQKTDVQATEQGPAYIIYSLKKTRQIVPLKPELFDHEQFGVLVYLEAISPMDTENIVTE